MADSSAVRRKSDRMVMRQSRHAVTPTTSGRRELREPGTAARQAGKREMRSWNSSVRAARRQHRIAGDDNRVRAVLQTPVVGADLNGARRGNALKVRGTGRARHRQGTMAAIHDPITLDARPAFLEISHRTLLVVTGVRPSHKRVTGQTLHYIASRGADAHSALQDLADGIRKETLSELPARVARRAVVEMDRNLRHRRRLGTKRAR